MAYVGHGGAGELDGLWDELDVTADEGDVGSFDGDVGVLALEFLDLGGFVLWEVLGEDVGCVRCDGEGGMNGEKICIL